MANPTCRKTQTGRHEFARMPYGTMVCVWCHQFNGTGTPIIEKRS